MGLIDIIKPLSAVLSSTINKFERNQILWNAEKQTRDCSLKLVNVKIKKCFVALPSPTIVDKLTLDNFQINVAWYFQNTMTYYYYFQQRI